MQRKCEEIKQPTWQNNQLAYKIVSQLSYTHRQTRRICTCNRKNIDSWLAAQWRRMMWQEKQQEKKIDMKKKKKKKNNKSMVE